MKHECDEKWKPSVFGVKAKKYKGNTGFTWNNIIEIEQKSFE